MKVPSYEDYIRIFHWHGMEEGDFLTKETDPQQVEACFRQVADLSRYRCLFNESLPAEFLNSLRAYHSGDEETLAYFSRADHRLFFLSDFLDYIKLTRRKSDS